jgi:hypothetical protein
MPWSMKWYALIHWRTTLRQFFCKHECPIPGTVAWDRYELTLRHVRHTRCVKCGLIVYVAVSITNNTPEMRAFCEEKTLTAMCESAVRIPLQWWRFL